MARFLIQSRTTGRFLCPSEDGGEPGWVTSLREAGGGVVNDMDTVSQLVEDNCDDEDMPILIDLDRLGTASDYKKTTSQQGVNHGH